jgi:exodeoxyribonuclease VII large subunit
MLFPPEIDSRSLVLSVSEVNRTARELLEQAFPLIWIGGEISNFMQASSGHCYFSLKDANAQVRCVMFRNKSQYLDWKPTNGMQVEVRALATLYEARGDFQLNVETMRRAGLGALYEAFEKLRLRLVEEGLFDPARKKPLPTFPRQIGIITSPAAAALRDVLTTLRRRMPSLPIVLYPVPVQGEGAAAKIAEAIKTAGMRAECDVLILCRGGGSIEDLWEFNQESVARAIAASPIPIVCGVGHETDVTIADFVADQRAPTPTAAAEMVSPNRVDLQRRLLNIEAGLGNALQRGLQQRMQHVDFLARRLTHPGERLQNQLAHIQHLQHRLSGAFQRRLHSERWRTQRLTQQLSARRPNLDQLMSQQDNLKHRMQHGLQRQMGSSAATLQRLQGHLTHLNPQSVLERGYSITQTLQGIVVRDSAQVVPGDRLKITFAKGRSEVQVVGKNEAG